MYTYKTEQWVPRPPEELFPFFADARNLQEITPGWLHFRILEQPSNIKPGAIIRYRLKLCGVPCSWVTRIAVWEPPHRFVDEQVRGPYKLWRHTHLLEFDRGGTRLTDEVQYELPFGWLGRIVRRLLTRRQIDRIFAYRAERIASLLAQSGPVP